MKNIFSKQIFSYVLGILLLLTITGGILSLITDNYIVLISVLAIVYFIFVVILLYLYDQYIKPIEKANTVVDQLVKGNYRSRIHHPANGIVGILSGKINLLARNLSELSIQERMQAEQLSTVINNTESGLVLIDEKGFIHLVNETFLEMFGNDSKDYVGYLYYDVLKNENIHKIVQETFLYEKNIKDTLTYTNKGKKYYEVVGAPIFNEREALKGTVLVFYNITELKNLEKMRKDFIANVSHELEVPIGSLAKSTELLQDEDMDLHLKNDLISDIRNESIRLELLVKDLLMLTKLERDNFKLDLSEISLENLAEDAIAPIEHGLKQTNLVLNVNVQEDLKLVADENKIKQILINLLGNAISYSRDKGDINLVIDEVENYVRLRVSDQGIGIGSKNVKRIFERFYRVSRARDKNPFGTGLGLAIVKHITEVHNGELTVESKKDVGTTFTILLPTESVEI